MARLVPRFRALHRGRLARQARRLRRRRNLGHLSHADLVRNSGALDERVFILAELVAELLYPLVLV